MAFASTDQYLNRAPARLQEPFQVEGTSVVPIDSRYLQLIHAIPITRMILPDDGNADSDRSFDNRRFEKGWVAFAAAAGPKTKSPKVRKLQGSDSRCRRLDYTGYCLP